MKQKSRTWFLFWAAVLAVMGGIGFIMPLIRGGESAFGRGDGGEMNDAVSRRRPAAKGDLPSDFNPRWPRRSATGQRDASQGAQQGGRR